MHSTVGTVVPGSSLVAVPAAAARSDPRSSSSRDRTYCTSYRSLLPARLHLHLGRRRSDIIYELDISHVDQFAVVVGKDLDRQT